MPYKSEKVRISGTSYDRRIKLTEEQRVQIRELYSEGGTSHRKLAQMFCVSRSLIRLIVDKEKAERAAESLKTRRLDGRYKPTRAVHAAITREHRQYKQDLYVNGIIKKE